MSADIVADTACPECAAGKHPNCDGGSWDRATDAPGTCPCWSREHEVMDADTWCVEARSHGGSTWASVVDRLSRQTADETAVFYAGRYPSWTLRLQDISTGQVVHLGHDGKPMPVDVTRLDRRTPEQIEADKAADRYEASLEVRR